MMGPEGTLLNRRYYSQESGKDLDNDEMVRGYEIEKDDYIVVTDEELERLSPGKTRDIDVHRFVPKDSISPIYFERSYFLTPGDSSEKAYRLLAETMEKRDRAGMATFVMRGKEYVIAIFSDNGILRAETMRFADELKSPAQIGLPKKESVPKGAVKRFENLIKRHSESRATAKELTVDDGSSLQKLAERKRSRGKDVIEVEEVEGETGNVVDLMEVLKKSIANKK